MLHPHTYSRSISGHRSRSTSRSRLSESGTPRYSLHRNVADVDDDETDEEAMVMDGEVEVEDDDVAEDEADQRTDRFKSQFSRSSNSRYEESQSQARSIAPTSVPLHRHPSGQATTMSASFERASSGLNRQYTSDRYAGSPASHYAMGRHHPYAIGSSNASPSNVGVLTSYSPSSARVGMVRRRSSFGNGSSAASPQPGHNMIQQLSHSPRYANARQQIGGPYEQPYPTSLPAHAYQPSGYHYGESADSNSMRRAGHTPSSGLGRGRDQGGEEEDDDDEDKEEEEDEKEDDGDEKEDEEEQEDEQERISRRASSTTKRASSKQTRKSSASRPAATSSTQGGTGDVESSEMNEVNAIRERLGGAANCSAFISKLWYLMCRPELYAVSVTD